MSRKGSQHDGQLPQVGHAVSSASSEQPAKIRTIIMVGTTLVVLALLGAALYVYVAARKAKAEATQRRQIAEYQSALAQAKSAIENNDLRAALERLQAARALPDHARNDELDTLLKEAKVAILPPDQLLRTMSDADFQLFCSTNGLPPSHTLSYGPLNRCYRERLLTAQEAEIARRNAIRDEAERKAQARAERLAREQAKRANAERTAKSTSSAAARAEQGPKWTPSQVYRKCMEHSFGDPKLGYTVGKMLDLLVGLWKIENPGRRITVGSGAAFPHDENWWKVQVVVSPEGEEDDTYSFYYDPGNDYIVLISKSAKDLFGPMSSVP